MPTEQGAFGGAIEGRGGAFHRPKKLAFCATTLLPRGTTRGINSSAKRSVAGCFRFLLPACGTETAGSRCGTKGGLFGTRSSPRPDLLASRRADGPEAFCLLLACCYQEDAEALKMICLEPIVRLVRTLKPSHSRRGRVVAWITSNFLVSRTAPGTG